MDSSREAFLGPFREQVVSLLRSQGFRGSGTTFRRIAGPLVHIVNVQASRDGKCCYINLAAHLAFLPAAGGASVPPPRLLESHCVFRSRVHPRPHFQFGWPYGPLTTVMPLLVPEVTNQAGAFFTALGTFPDSFLVVSPKHFQPGVASLPVLPILSLTGVLPYTFALIHQHLGNRAVARGFAEVGLAQSPITATSLRALYKRVIAAA